ncbi:MAG: hypothetical protein II840_00640 [Kiritimatiellae bacterium]|nr:hypothetical protein [Kiritimatiellia bacterium]
MMALFQTVLMRLALCGLAASLLLLTLRSRMARDTFARLLSIWRSLTAFGRVAICSFLLIGVLVGGDKTNGVNNLPPQQMMPPMAQHVHCFLCRGESKSGQL